jgi:hypothetical protein
MVNGTGSRGCIVLLRSALLSESAATQVSHYI